MKLKGTGALQRVVVENKAPVQVVETVKPAYAPHAALGEGQGDRLEKGAQAKSGLPMSTSTIGATGGAGGGSTLLRAKLSAELDKPKAKPPAAQELPDASVVPQPNLYVSSLGNYAQLAKFVDDNYGNRDGIITVAELQKFVGAYGRDPAQRNNIVGLAMMLGVATVEQGGHIQLVNGNSLGITVNISIGGGQTTITTGGGGLRYEDPPRRTTNSNANTSTSRATTRTTYDVAHAMVRQRPDADYNTVHETIRSLSVLPPKVLQILESNGIRVIVANRITDYRPDLRFERPRGWPPGSTWEQPAGMYDPNRKEIVIAIGGSNARVVAHEVGHALDAIGWTRSREATFMKMYNHDYNSLVRNGEHYLIQPGDAGPSEAFAESHAWYQTNPHWLAAAYPNLHAYWDWVVKNGYREVGG